MYVERLIGTVGRESWTWCWSLARRTCDKFLLLTRRTTIRPARTRAVERMAGVHLAEVRYLRARRRSPKRRPLSRVARETSRPRRRAHHRKIGRLAVVRIGSQNLGVGFHFRNCETLSTWSSVLQCAKQG